MDPGPKTSPFSLPVLYHTFKKNAIPFIEKIIPFFLRDFHPIIVYAQTRDLTRESLAWKIFSFLALGIEQFIDDKFLCLRSDVVHHLHPPQLIGFLEVFVDVLSLGKLYCQRGQHFVCLFVNPGEVGIEPSFTKQSGVPSATVLLEIVKMHLTVFADGLLFG